MTYFQKTLMFVIWAGLSGCTLNFKAKEIELDSKPPITYELETFELLGGKQV